MRLVLAGVLLVGSSLQADVRLLVKADGRKVIYNTPSSRPRSISDYQWLARQHDRRSQYDPIIERYARQYRVDPVLVRAVIQVESDFDPQCVSRKGARGLMQLMPGTAKRYRVQRIHDPNENIRGGIHYLRDLLMLFRNDLPRVLAAYNAGENAVIRFKGIPPYEETDTYVKRALTVYHGRPYGQAIMFAGRRDKATLHGGFAAPTTPALAAILPGVRYLGSH
jgi:soluble lytic murein transglycosylase-like protein